MSVRAATRAQSLDQQITIQRKAITRSTSGSAEATWSALVTCRARVDGAKGSEPLVEGGVRTRRDYTVWIRAAVYTHHSITASDRILWGTKLLSIRDVADQGVRAGLIPLGCDLGVHEQ